MKVRKKELLVLTSKSNIFYVTSKAIDLETFIDFHDPRPILIVSETEKEVVADPRYKGLNLNGISTTILSEKNTSFIDQFFKHLLKKNRKEISFEFDSLRYSDANYLFPLLEKNHIKIIDCSQKLLTQRAKKSKGELLKIKAAQKETDEVFYKTIKFIKAERTETEVVSFIVNLVNQKKLSLSFTPIIASGKNSSIPHHTSTNKKITNGEPVLIDLGITKNGYCSDMTRTVFIGKPKKELQKIYNDVKNTLEALKKTNINKLSISKLCEFSENNLNHYEKFSYKYFHSLGHGVGINIHEKPSINKGNKNKLQSREVITLEPAVYVKNKYGVRLEDMVVIENGEVKTISQIDLKTINLN